GSRIPRRVAMYTALLVTCVVSILVGVIDTLYGWVSWRRVRWPRRLTGPALVLAGASVLQSAQSIVWDGGYPVTEFQLTFVNPDGRPVEGVELRVENREGTNYFYYPVTDYLPGQTPTSDRNGLMEFHHVGRAIEFHGRYTSVGHPFFTIW